MWAEKYAKTANRLWKLVKRVANKENVENSLLLERLLNNYEPIYSSIMVAVVNLLPQISRHLTAVTMIGT